MLGHNMDSGVFDATFYWEFFQFAEKGIVLIKY